MCEVTVLKNGYAFLKDGFMHANCTCTVVRSPENTVIVDTMTPWDGPFIQSKLQEIGVPQIDYVISSHGHSDHTGNNNLFIENVKQHIVGFCISNNDQYYAHPFEHDEEYKLDEWMTIVPTPGHTSEDITLVVKTKTNGMTAIAGDLFECQDDLTNSELWIANSFNPEKQASNRLKILRMVDTIIPGHGGQFNVLPEHVETAQKIVDKYGPPK
ncbi:unnamed protein product [Orchesella dallaii]|uniref:Metallo-beta-lactamase domain-containing protein 1 n=1 Tax=Orchesella dallaii TaxID=48710 RepID=A0ABP1QFF2_9HEXA